MKERYWANLVSTLRHGQCVLVLGPEIPAEAGPQGATNNTSAERTYADALKSRLAAELEEDGRRVTPSSLAGVAQQYEDAEGFGTGNLRSQAARFYASAPLEPSAVHRALALLPFPLILSTCQDRLLTDALQQAAKTPTTYAYNIRGDRSDNPEFVVPGAPHAPLVYHLFGTFDEPQSLVISENDLLDFLIAVVSERPPLPNSLRRALQRPGVSLLFVGFGIRHWYLRVLLKALVRSVRFGRSVDAIALEPLLHHTPDFDRQQTILFYQRGTRIEVCDDDIFTFVAELAQRLANEGGIVAQQESIGPRPRVFLSYASEDNALAVRLFAALQQAGFVPWIDKDGLRGGDDWNLLIEEQLRDAEYVLVVETSALAAKRVGYVNKEIALARSHAQRYRGSFLIPLVVDDLPQTEQLAELSEFQRMPLRKDHFQEDLSALVSTIRRDYQRRQR